MIYEEFIAESQRRQRAYIQEELARIEKATAAWWAYERAMAALRLHPLTRTEIVDRRHQLEQMSRDVEKTHGDTPGQRAIFEARLHESAR